MKTGPNHCIVRIDLEKPKSQHCWEVKIIRPTNSFHKSFSDSRYGGKDGAYAAAVKCRDKEIRTRQPMTSYECAIRPNRTNKSGIVGVRRCMQVVRRGSKTWQYPVWAVTGTPISGGKTKSRYFSINVWGDKIAKQKAIEQRKEWEDSLRASVEEKTRSASAQSHT